ncbi:MAG TPA: LuxR C-terminal-related transcriptional regulator [bacterium]|nr:LuxR C-terminal-related transcriptional regulator [bacterium]
MRTLPAVDLAELVDGTGDPAFAVDAAQTIVAWNRAAAEFFAVAAPEALGRDCGQLIGGRNRDGHIVCTALCPFRLAMRRGERLAAMEVQVRPPGRPPVWVRMSSIIFPGPDPCVIHLLHDATDDHNREAFVQQVMQAASALSGARAARGGNGPPVLLSPREMEILRLLARGAGTREIAQSLSISVATVRNHIQQIMTALRAHSRLEAVVKAMQRGLF